MNKNKNVHWYNAFRYRYIKYVYHVIETLVICERWRQNDTDMHTHTRIFLLFRCITVFYVIFFVFYIVIFIRMKCILHEHILWHIPNIWWLIRWTLHHSYYLHYAVMPMGERNNAHSVQNSVDKLMYMIYRERERVTKLIHSIHYVQIEMNNTGNWLTKQPQLIVVFNS